MFKQAEIWYGLVETSSNFCSEAQDSTGRLSQGSESIIEGIVNADPEVDSLDAEQKGVNYTNEVVLILKKYLDVFKKKHSTSQVQYHTLHFF